MGEKALMPLPNSFFSAVDSYLISPIEKISEQVY
ncbi:MAG: hypothetical protein K0S07_267 [Chlamydiales bacterium]|nr:hypothetical protein [Chlamydiales bacterium]